MAKQIGRLDSFGFGKESPRGIAVSITKWIPWMDGDFEDKVKTAVDEVSLARVESSDDEVVVSIYGDVTLGSKVKDNTIGYPLMGILGSVSSVAKSAPNADVYDHTFSVLQSTQTPSYTIGLKGPNNDVSIPNGVFDSLKIDAKQNAYVMFETHILGKPSASASHTVSHTAGNDFHAKHITFKLADTQSGLTAASAITIKNVSIEIKRNAILDEVLGSTPVNDVLAQSFDISGSFTILHENNTYQGYMLAGTPKALRLQMVNTGVTIGSSANPGLVIDLHKVIFNDRSRTRSLNDLVEETITFKAHFSLTDSKMITAVLTNEDTAY